MFLVSRVVTAAARALGPAAEFRLEIARLHRYGRYEVEWYLLDLLCDRRRAALDIGANLGHYSGRLARLCPLVHAFEPIARLAAELRRKLPASVTVHELALSDHAGAAVLRVPRQGSDTLDGLATLESTNDLAVQLEHKGGVVVEQAEVALETLDALHLPNIGFIKIDVEGHEAAVLRGARATIIANRPTLLIEAQRVTHPEAPANVMRFLEDLGYSGWFLRGPSLMPTAAFSPDHDQDWRDGRERYVNNFIFLPHEPAPAWRNQVERRVARTIARRGDRNRSAAG